MTRSALDRSAEASAELEAMLLEEYGELSRRVVQQRERAEVLRRLADQATADERLLNDLAETLGIACQLRIEQLDRRLRGQRLQEIAVEILAARLEPGQPVHYKQWFEWVEQQGFKVAGKDPLATFLGQIARSPRVRSVGRRSGLYMLREAA